MRAPLTRWRRLTGGAGAVAVAVALAACDVPDDQHQVRMRLDDPPPAGGAYTTFANTGSASVAIDVASRNGGTLVEGPGQGGSPRSVRYPAHDPATTSPRAVVRVTNPPTGDDVLNPGTRAFSWGADVRMDSVTSAPGTQDDGDNVIQRGLYDDTSQYKLQVDGFRPSCRASGAAGAVEVFADVRLTPGVWYRLLCTRDGDRLTVSVTSWDAQGTASTVDKVKVGPSGDMTPSARSVPLSVGGKLKADGTVAGATDQFNGWIDNPRLRFLP